MYSYLKILISFLKIVLVVFVLYSCSAKETSLIEKEAIEQQSLEENSDEVESDEVESDEVESEEVDSEDENSEDNDSEVEDSEDENSEDNDSEVEDSEDEISDDTDSEDVENDASTAPECYDLVWSDEFEGVLLDTEKWRYQNGGWNGSNVQNCYVEANTTVADGSLKITAKYEPGYDCFDTVTDFTSGFVQTKDKVNWTFGYFEAKVKVPASDSTWPAFWMSPQDPIYGDWPQSGEIDIFEIKGHDLTKTYGNAHWGNSGTDKVQDKGIGDVINAEQWHIYAVEWSLGELKFYLDGELYHTINDFKAPNATTHPGPFNIGYYLRFNMAVGGNYLSEPHNDANQNIDQLSATMEVDYVRVFQKRTGC